MGEEKKGFAHFSRPFSLRPFFLTRHLFKNPQNLQ
jgi:hypothetical protein